MKSKHSGDPEPTESNADYGYADSLDTNEHEQISTLKTHITHSDNKQSNGNTNERMFIGVKPYTQKQSVIKQFD